MFILWISEHFLKVQVSAGLTLRKSWLEHKVHVCEDYGVYVCERVRVGKSHVHCHGKYSALGACNNYCSIFERLKS